MLVDAHSLTHSLIAAAPTVATAASTITTTTTTPTGTVAATAAAAATVAAAAAATAAYGHCHCYCATTTTAATASVSIAARVAKVASAATCPRVEASSGQPPSFELRSLMLMICQENPDYCHESGVLWL